jgi:phospholipid transport system substrate-binding protein
MERWICLAAVLMLTVLAGAETPPATQPDPSPRDVIDSVMKDVLTVLRDPTLTRETKLKKVRQIADEQIDFVTLSRLSMGSFWRGLSDAQKADFVTAFTEHLSITHANIVDAYVDEDVQITGDRPEVRGDETVETRIVGKKEDGGSEEVAKVDYRLRQTAGRWKIIDVTIDGVSMVANFRAQFQEIMSNGGFDQLLQLIRQKNAAGEK